MPKLEILQELSVLLYKTRVLGKLNEGMVKESVLFTILNADEM